MNYLTAKAEPLHSPDGKKRGGADARTLGGPLVMQIVSRLSCYMISYLWLLPICISSFACTRGLDGEFFISLFLFPVLGLSHLLFCAIKHVDPKHTSLQFFLFTALSIISCILYSEINGMAGILLILIPSIVSLFAFIAVILTYIIYQRDRKAAN